MSWTLHYAALLAYTWVIITYKLNVASIAILIAMVGVARGREKIRFPPLVLWFATLLVWGGVAYMASPYSIAAWTGFIVYAKLVVILWVAVNALRSREQIRLYLLLFVAWFVLIPARAAMVMYFQGHRLFGRAVGSFIYENPNDLAALTMIAGGMALAAFSLTAHQRLVRVGLLLCVGFLGTLVLLTQSRGAFLGLVVMCGPYFLRAVRSNSRNLLAGVALVGIMVAVAPQELWQRIGGLSQATSVESMRTADAEGSANERIDILLTGVEAMRHHWAVGVGMGAAPMAQLTYGDLGYKDAHNTYLTVAMEGGIPGLLVFLGMIGWTLRYSAASVRIARRAGLVAEAEALDWLHWTLMGFLVVATFATTSRHPHFYLLMATVWALGEATRARVRPRAPVRASS